MSHWLKKIVQFFGFFDESNEFSSGVTEISTGFVPWVEVLNRDTWEIQRVSISVGGKWVESVAQMAVLCSYKKEEDAEVMREFMLSLLKQEGQGRIDVRKLK